METVKRKEKTLGKGNDVKICFIGPANSAHIIKWCKWFTAHGHEIHVISFTPGEIENTAVHLIDLGVDVNGSDLEKLRYLLTGRKIRRLVHEIRPDIVNVHYATSYGIAAALSGIKQYVLSVWGSDIYDFPKKSLLHRALLKFSLRRASTLFSTSKAMACEAAKYTRKEFEITPFGVDMKLFNPDKRTRPQDVPFFTIGTVKTLTALCGIEDCLKAAAIIKSEYKELDISVRISGDDPDQEKHREIVKELGIDGITEFLGRISQEQAAAEWAGVDVAVIPAALYKTVAAAKPDESGIVFERKNERYIADAIIRLYQASALRREAGEKGRLYVNENCELQSSFEKIEKLAEEAFREHAGAISLCVDIKKKQDFIVGTVKSLSDSYGIADILSAVSIVKRKGEIPIKLRIAGKGPQEEEYRRLANELEIDDVTTWLGFISQEKAAEEWANMDVAVIPSTMESFGVAAVEAQACGTAVIITDIPGLMEATEPGKTSVVVHKNSPDEIAREIERLSNDKVRRPFSNNGLIYVRKNYELNGCFQRIENAFKDLERKG